MIEINPCKAFVTTAIVTSCIDDHIATVASWLGKDYRWMYARALEFSSVSSVSDKLMERTHHPLLDLDLLESQHGLHPSFF